MFANVYRSMRDVGMPDPRRVDELELWEIAVLIGADKEAAAGADDKYAHLRARVAHEQYREQLEAFEQGEGPMPGAAPPAFEWTDDDDGAELMAVLASGSSLT